MTRWKLLSHVPTLAALASACLFAEVSSARTVLVDFGRDNQLTAGNYNNAAAPAANFADLSAFPTQANMVDTTGATTSFGLDLVGVDLDTNTGLGIGGFNAVPNPNGSGFDDQAARDTMFLNGGAGTATFQVADLNPTDTYTLTMYNFIGGQNRQPTRWTVDGTNIDLDPQNNTSGTAVFSNVPAAGGAIDIGYSVFNDGNGGGATGQWNAFSIVNDNTGEEVLIDFGLDTQPTAGNYNNALDVSRFWEDESEFPTLTDMVSSTGATTTVDFDLIDAGTRISAGGGPIGTGIAGFQNVPSPNNSGFDDQAARDSLFVNSGTVAFFEITGLDPTNTYDLSFYGFVGGNGRPDTLIEIDGVVDTYNPQNNTGEDQASFFGLSPDGLGTIAFSVSADEAIAGQFRQAQLGALRIVEVPEPCTITTLGTVLFVAVRRRR